MEKIFKYQSRIDALRIRKLTQTKEKINIEGPLDEDDYGRVVMPKDPWKIIPNNPDGGFYGLDGWTNNFCSMMDSYPLYVDPKDMFAGRWVYFLSRMKKNKWNPKYPYNHLKGNIEKYNIICGIGDDAHFAPDFKIGLTLGWQGILKKIEHYRKINNTTEQIHFYDAHERAVKSIQGWILRHIKKIEHMISEEKDPELKKNLEEMAETNRNIVYRAPKTLREACQWMIWYHLSSRTYNRDGAGGQLDELLRPYYEKDLAEGRIDRDKAVYLIACFLLNDPVYWQLGGPDKNGKDQTSEISFIILDGADEINTSINITIRVHDGLNLKLFRKAIEYLVKNKNGWPRFSGDKALVEGFMKNGYSAELARQRIAVGCNWMSLPGLEYTLNDLVKVNMARVFELAYIDQAKDNIESRSLESLWEYFHHHLSVAVRTAADGIRFHLKYQKYNEPELILNLLSHGPLEKGLDVSNGGAEYYNLAIDGAGLAIVADSFAAIEQRITKEKKISWSQLDYYLKNDFEGVDGERIRQLMKHSQHYGQGNSSGDWWAKKVSKEFSDMVRKETCKEEKLIFIPGLFSWANTIEFGEHVGATPNGRRSKTPISHGANPSPGFATEGASLSLARAVAEVQPGYGNTAPMQWELDPTFATKDYIGLIGSIIKTHFDLGGTLINVNIMDKKKVLEANKDPKKYPDLLVRVTGFTAYFAMLTPKFRQLVVNRILEN